MTTIAGSQEIYRKLSSQIESQFPEFIRSDGPKFVLFLKAYFEYLEQSGKAIDESRALFDTLDIDRTADEFIEYFHREFLINIPRTVLADKRLLVKHIRDFYRTRGSQASYRFLFRALFNEEIEFYYPGDDILRASDGRWAKETVIRGIAAAGDPHEMDGKQITGLTSGATARVQEILNIVASGISLYQLRAENVIGTFVEDEVVSDGTNMLRIYNAVGAIANVAIISGGAFHRAGDSITLAGDTIGSATGVILGTTANSGVTFRITNGGSGYRVSNTVFTISGGNPDVPAQLRIVNISNTSLLTLNTNLINPVRNVVLSTNPFGLGSAVFATKNVNSTLLSALTFSNVTIGSINTIALITPGSGYTGELPSVDALDTEVLSQFVVDSERGGFKGHNAVIIASRVTGAIERVSITSSTDNFLKYDNITITNITRSDANTTDTSTDTYGGITRGLIRKGIFPAIVSGTSRGTFALPGRYIDTKGFLSWNNRLEDSEFYQEFSYVIHARKLLDDYKNILKALVHPAGTKMIGSFRTETGLDLGGNVATSTLTYKKAPNYMRSNTALKQIISTTTPHWYANGTLKANSGAISVGGRGANLMIVSVSNTSGSNGLYQVNTITSNTRITLRLRYEHGGISNGYFYYNTLYRGAV